MRLLAAGLIILGGLVCPLIARVLAEVNERVALVLPSLVLVAAISFICPEWFIPPAALGGVHAVDLTVRLVRGSAIGPCLSYRIFQGQATLLWVPLAALVLGGVLVYERRRIAHRLIPRAFRTNLHVLGRRPLVFARKYWLPLLVVVIATLLDTLSTIEFMLETGTAAELHPGMRVAAEVYGVVPGTIIGTLTRLGFVVFVAAIWRKACPWVMALLAVVYILAAMSNHYQWQG